MRQTERVINPNNLDSEGYLPLLPSLWMRKLRTRLMHEVICSESLKMFSPVELQFISGPLSSALSRTQLD